MDNWKRKPGAASFDADGIRVTIAGYRGGQSVSAMNRYEENRQRLSNLLFASKDLLSSCIRLLAVLEEPGVMDVDEWKYWKRREADIAREVIARTEQTKRPTQ